MGLLDKLDTMVNNIIFSLVILISFLLIPSGSHIDNNQTASEAYIEFLSDCNLEIKNLTGSVKIKASKLSNGSGRVGFRVYEPMRFIFGTSILRGAGFIHQTSNRWILDYVIFARSSYTATMSHPRTDIPWGYLIHAQNSIGNPQPNIGTRLWITGPAEIKLLAGKFEFTVNGVTRTLKIELGTPLTLVLR